MLFDGSCGFSTAIKFDKASLKNSVSTAIRAARILARFGNRVELADTSSNSESVRAEGVGQLADVPVESKMRLCKTLAKEAYSYSPRVRSANAFYFEIEGERSIATSDGTIVNMEQSRLYYSITAISRKNITKVSATERRGVLGRREAFENIDPARIATTASERAVRSSRGKLGPTGSFPVILDPQVAGVFIHEAVGHAAEADVIVSKESIFQGKIGQRVGSPLLTVYDDPTVNKGWGTVKYDDEGTLARKKTLIQNGRLREYILDRTTASKLKMHPNGGGRVQYYNHPIIPRMSNTYISPGEPSLEELVEEIREGVLIRGARGGQGDPSNGTFQFSAEDAQLIEHGKLATILLEVSLSGSTLSTLDKIDRVGKETSFITSFCNKADQSLPSQTGGPHVRIGKLALGGGY